MSRDFISWSDFVPVGREQEYLHDAFRSGWVSGGAYVEKLEVLLRSVFSGSSAYAVANGTVALQLAFQTLGVRPGSEVIVPAFCFQAASNVLVQLGATPVFCDIDPLTWNQTVQTLERAITCRTVGVVVVHNYGASAPAAEIRQWADARGIWMIEDCAEAWFSKYRGQYLGQYGVLGTFSMHATKPIACGEGGVVLLNDKTLDETVRLLRSHGLDRTRTHYLHSLAGSNYRLSNLLAAVAYGQLERRDRILSDQEQRLRWYTEALSGHWACRLQHSLHNAADNIWAVAVRIPFWLLTITRDDMILALKAAGIETRPGFYAASALKYHDSAKAACPVADSLCRDLIVMPCSPKLTEYSVHAICRQLLELVEMHTKADVDFRIEVLGRDDAAIARVRTFDKGLQDGRAAFRYFAKRPYDVIRTHARTLLLSNHGRDIGYGHLETEAGVTWLGIALADDQRGYGWGKLLMQRLLIEAAALDVGEVALRVDANNPRAIRLYEQFGFVPQAEGIGSGSLLMKKLVMPSMPLRAH